MMLLLDFAVACVDCTGGNKKKKKKKHGNRFNNNIDREYLSVNNDTCVAEIYVIFKYAPVIIKMCVFIIFQ